MEGLEGVILGGVGMVDHQCPHPSMSFKAPTSALGVVPGPMPKQASANERGGNMTPQALARRLLAAVGPQYP